MGWLLLGIVFITGAASYLNLKLKLNILRIKAFLETTVNVWLSKQDKENGEIKNVLQEWSEDSSKVSVWSDEADERNLIIRFMIYVNLICIAVHMFFTPPAFVLYFINGILAGANACVIVGLWNVFTRKKELQTIEYFYIYHVENRGAT